MEKKFDGNYTWMLRTILNKSWRQHPTNQQLYGHLPLITKTIQVRRTRHAGYCWGSKDKVVNDVLLWTPSLGRANAEWPARTYIQQLCVDTGCSFEDLPEVMYDRDGWRKRVREIHPSGATSWWWYINVCVCAYARVHVCMCVCVCVRTNMKKQGILVMIYSWLNNLPTLNASVFTFRYHQDSWYVIYLQNYILFPFQSETKKWESFNILFLLVAFCFKTIWRN